MRRTFILAILYFTAIAAFIGGVGLMAEWIRPPLAWIHNSIFASYVFPGIILTVVVGGSALSAAMAYQRRVAIAPFVTFCAGFVLVGWILGEIATIQTLSWLQAVFAVIGLLLIGLTYDGAKQFVLCHAQKTSLHQ